METPLRKKKDWVLTEQNLKGFLALLDKDTARAGEQYEILRHKLLRFFRWRGSQTPEELADETLNRLARKIDEGEAIRNLSGYLGGMARLVWLEAVKEQERERSAFEELRASSQYTAEADSQRVDYQRDDSQRMECFESCLESLLAENRTLILDYYREERAGKIELRKQLAEKMGVPLNAIRIRAHRIRGQLENCVAECMRNAG